MRTTRITTALCVLGACLALAACGDDEPTATTGGQPTAAADATETGAVDTPQPVETRPSDGAQTPKPEKTVEGLPSSTPEPGPPLRFGAVITADSIEVDTKTVESGPSLEVRLENRSEKLVPINLFANGVTVASGQIKPGDKPVAAVRNLDPGKLVFVSGKLRTTIKVVDEE
jgi:hypothetical protein